MAYAADKITVNGIQLGQLEKMDIVSEAGEHGKLTLCGYLVGEQGAETLYGITEEESISIYVEQTLIFSGIITKAKIYGVAETIKIEVEAKSRSILMDRKKKSRSFQDISMTYSQLVKFIMAEYPESDIMLSIEDRPLGDIAVQYKETDWIFLKRMLSQLHAAISCRVASETLQLYGGVPDVVKEKWDYEVKGYQKELGIYNYWLQLGMNVSDTDFFVTEIETNHVPELFEEVEDAGKPMVIQSFSYSMTKGLLCCSCRLQKKEGILAPVRYPMHLIGVALEGNVLEISGIKIRLHLKIDDGNSLSDTYWFPFSTLSASPDGSGWYYMPEKGDNIRVYFPSKFTKDVIAVSAVSNYDGKSGGVPDRMGNPANKYLSNPGGQQMKLAEDGIYLACSGESACVKIGNDGAIEVSSQNTVEVTADNNVSIEAEEAVVIQASETAVISCTKGGTMQMPPDGNLYIQGSEVKLD